MTLSQSSMSYPLYSKCELTSYESPIFLSELHEQLNQLDNIDLEEVARLGTQTATIQFRTFDQVPLSLSDFFAGLAQLATTGAVEVTEIVEAIHSEILLRPFGRFNEENLNRWQQGFTRRMYNLVRQTMNLVGNNLTSTGVQLYNRGTVSRASKPLPEVFKSLVNVLNGIMGDHLVTQNNPLAVPMVLFDRYGQPLHTDLSGRVIVICHGLCLSYLSWHPCEEDSLGEAIMQSMPKVTILYLDYNTGRRISQNGQCLANLLQQLVEKNPDISQIDLIGYSMGGLVVRSALFYAELLNYKWTDRAFNLITIGSPHKGAGLERIGSHVLDIVSKVPFAGSLSKLGNIRSAGIIDLRHGSIRDEDWTSLEGRNILPAEFKFPADIPLHINTFLIAGSIIEGLYSSKATTLVGDGLVTIESALDEGASEHSLSIPEGHKAVFYGVNHMNLQYDQRVHDQIIDWLQDNGKTDYSFKLRKQSYPYGDDIEVAV